MMQFETRQHCFHDRICADVRFQLYFCIILCEVDRAYAGQLAEETSVTREFDTQGISSVLILDGCRRAMQDGVAFVDHQQLIAEPFRLFHLMSRKNNGAIVALELQECLLHQNLIDRVESGK